MSSLACKDKGRIASRLWTTKRARTRVYLYNLEEQKEQSTSKRDENDVKIIKK